MPLRGRHVDSKLIKEKEKKKDLSFVIQLSFSRYAILIVIHSFMSLIVYCLHFQVINNSCRVINIFICRQRVATVCLCHQVFFNHNNIQCFTNIITG